VSREDHADVVLTNERRRPEDATLYSAAVRGHTARTMRAGVADGDGAPRGRNALGLGLRPRRYAWRRQHDESIHSGPGTLWAWGDNTFGQVGDGTTTNSLVTVQVTGLPSNPIVVAAGRGYSLALLDNGTIWTWGDGSLGQLGDGSMQSSANPVQVAGLRDFISVAAGGAHALAVHNNGTVWGPGETTRSDKSGTER
jgi:Regulator of chromosome condensation (RCC1) repeat